MPKWIVLLKNASTLVGRRHSNFLSQQVRAESSPIKKLNLKMSLAKLNLQKVESMRFLYKKKKNLSALLPHSLPQHPRTHLHLMLALDSSGLGYLAYTLKWISDPWARSMRPRISPVAHLVFAPKVVSLCGNALATQPFNARHLTKLYQIN